MKRSLLLLLLIAFSATLMFGGFKTIRQYNKRTHQYTDYPLVTVHDINYVSRDSLALANAIQLTQPSRWTLVCSQFYHWDPIGDSLMRRDTVVIEAVVVVPCSADSPYAGITYTQWGWTMLVHDPTPVNEWTGCLVRVGVAPKTVDSLQGPDTTRARSSFFTNPRRGDLVQMTGYIDEYPSSTMNAMVEFTPDFDYPVTILSHNNPIPAPTPVTIDSFMVGTYPTGNIQYTSGLQYAGSLVMETSSPSNTLNVTTVVNSSRGTFNFVDGAGNSMSDYDVSHFFTFGNESQPVIPGDTSFHLPPVGAVIDTIRGSIFTSSGGENPRGYRITPLFKGDLKLGISLPTVIGHRRYPVVVTSVDTATIQDTVRYTLGGLPIYQAQLVYSINNGPWQTEVMTLTSADSVYKGTILDPDGQPLATGTQVRYFLKGVDNGGNTKLLANGSALLNSDTSKGFFFYTVQQSSTSLFTIHDLQYTPYANGVGPYVGGLVNVGGIVTASSNDLGLTQRNPNAGEAGTNAWFIQSTSQPWSGIWVQKSTTDTSHNLDSLKRGDSVVVFGTVSNYASVSQIIDSTVTVIAHNRPVPAPVTLSTANFGPGVGKGNPLAEPYLGMLVRFTNSKIAKLHPTFADSSEYSIQDNSGTPVLVRQDGLNTWSNTPADTSLGKTVFFSNDAFDTLIGVVTFGNRVYKVCPRLNDDLTIGDTVSFPGGWNLLSVYRTQMPSANWATSYLFPGVSSFGYNGSYYVAGAMYPGSGYWLRMNGTETFRQHGSVIKSDTIAITPGWNLVGAPGTPMSTGSVTVTPPGNHLSSFFGYNLGYVVETSLNPGQGYWVKADSAGTLIETGSSIVPKAAPVTSRYNSITITDAKGNSQTLYFVQDGDNKINLRDFEMPPMFPAEEFAVKFGSGRILETYPAGQELKTFPISIAAKHGPFTISWSITTREAKQYLLTDGANGKFFKSIELKGTGTARNINAAVVQPALQVNAGTALPREFALSQNYPNPFNPTTRVQVALPQNAHLEVAVFNILGQKVATLVDENRQAGFHVVEWNGLNDHGTAVSSGVYFIRMTADKFTATRKMMLMK